MTEHPSNELQKSSSSYRIAIEDPSFLESRAQRGVRLMLEYEKAEEILKLWRINSTIVCYGSARVGEKGSDRHAQWYAAAREFGRIVSVEGGAKFVLDGGLRENVIATGGGPGLMEAANRGAYDAGAPSIGFNITLPHEQEPNPYTTPELTFQFHYFSIRKMHLVMRAAALVAFPGGFGTFDELFEVMTLRQTGKSRAIPIILYDEDYWRSVVNFERIAEEGLISPQDLNIFQFASGPREAWEKIVAARKGTALDR
ncbi:MAG: TIGR00730 family Rossman fold protein [Hyphomicrobiales bacterium]|nr:TIGR00730 family Rossman fold protein [Hyphomicrobiales bacterium]